MRQIRHVRGGHGVERGWRAHFRVSADVRYLAGSCLALLSA